MGAGLAGLTLGFSLASFRLRRTNVPPLLGVNLALIVFAWVFLVAHEAVFHPVTWGVGLVLTVVSALVRLFPRAVGLPVGALALVGALGFWALADGARPWAGALMRVEQPVVGPAASWIGVGDSGASVVSVPKAVERVSLEWDPQGASYWWPERPNGDWGSALRGVLASAGLWTGLRWQRFAVELPPLESSPWARWELRADWENVRWVRLVPEGALAKATE